MYEARTGTTKDLRKPLENLPEDAQLTLMAPVNLDGTSVFDGHPKKVTNSSDLARCHRLGIFLYPTPLRQHYLRFQF